MRIFTLLTFFICTAIQSFCQQDADKLLYLQKSQKYKRMKTTGTVLTLGGSVLMVVGMATLLNATEQTNTYYGSSSTVDTNKAAGGAVVYIAGAAAIGTGIPLWIVGGINHGKYNRKLQELSARFVVSPKSSGVKLTFRF